MLDDTDASSEIGWRLKGVLAFNPMSGFLPTFSSQIHAGWVVSQLFAEANGEQQRVLRR